MVFIRPYNLKTRIFLDGGDPEETKDIIRRMGFLDGQTTNPTLISKSPGARSRLDRGMKYSADEALDLYRQVVRTVSGLIPQGSVSIEVYADAATVADEMLQQGRDLYAWIPNAHIKFPTTQEGLKAAGLAAGSGMRVNLTLCFSQEQAAAVYAATLGARKGQVFVSPFIGRLDDRGENGMDVISNIIRMYAPGDGHVEVLTASVRSIGHFLQALKLGSDIITAPYNVLKAWTEGGMVVPGAEYRYDAGSLRPIPYKEIGLSRTWTDYDLSHDLTDKGMAKFSADWNDLISSERKKTA